MVICGLRVGVLASDEDALQRVLRYLPAGWKVSSSQQVYRLYSFSAGQHGVDERLYINGQWVRGPQENDGILPLLESDLTAFLISKIRNRVCVHAGVVGWDGKAVIIPVT